MAEKRGGAAMESTSNRVVCWFSCGAASSYAAYLAKQRFKDIELVYCKVIEEHPDSLRFLADFEKVIGQEIKIIGDAEMEYSAHRVFEKRGFIKNQYGAPCTMILKKWQRENYQKPTDIQIFGYTVEEQHRVDRFIDSNNDVTALFPLVEENITKKDCLEWLTEKGIELPVMYKLGYQNNNCIGCVKGGMGYWNAIRVDFPEAFDKAAKLERKLNHAINKDKEGPVFLDELSPDRGNFKRDQPPACGFTCEWKQQELL